MLEGISPWPWGMRKDGEGGWVIIHSDLDDEKHDLCYSADPDSFEDADFERRRKDFRLIASAPQLISELVEEVETLKIKLEEADRLLTWALKKVDYIDDGIG